MIGSIETNWNITIVGAVMEIRRLSFYEDYDPWEDLTATMPTDVS